MVTIAFAYGVAFVLLKNYLMPEYVFMDYYQSHYPHLERRHAGGLIAFAVIKLFLVLAGTSFGLEWTTPFLIRCFWSRRLE